MQHLATLVVTDTKITARGLAFAVYGLSNLKDVQHDHLFQVKKTNKQTNKQNKTTKSNDFDGTDMDSGV